MAAVETMRPCLAEAADLPTIQHLYRDLDASHGLVDGDLGKRDDSDRASMLKNALHGRRGCIFVARGVTSRLRVVGFIMAGFSSRGTDLIIEALMVHQDCRRQGIGTALIQAVEEWALARKVRFVELSVFEFNPEARGFYESLGYLTVERRMRRDPKFDVQELVRARKS